MTSSGWFGCFHCEISQQGDWMWSLDAGGGSSSRGQFSSGRLPRKRVCAGSFSAGISFGNLTYSAGGTENSFIARANDLGNSASWEWALQLSSSNSNSAQDLSFRCKSRFVVTGEFRGTVFRQFRFDK